MYRILSSPSSRVSSVLNSSSQSFERSRLCCHCLQIHRLQPREVNFYSQYLAVLNQLWKKKKQKSGKKQMFTELLEVTKTKTKESKRTVGKLNANSVTEFAEQPGIVLLSNMKSLPTRRPKCSPQVYHYDRTRCYDPIVILPVDILNQFVDNLITNDSQKIESNMKPSSKKSEMDGRRELNPGMNRTPTILGYPEVQEHLNTGRIVLRPTPTLQAYPEFQDDPEISDLIGPEGELHASMVESSPIDNYVPENVFSCQDPHIENDPAPEELIAMTEVLSENKKQKRGKNESKAKKAKAPSYPVNLKKKIRESLAKQAAEKLELERKTAILHDHLSSYLNISAESGLLDEAMETLKYFNRIKRKNNFPKIQSVNIHNILLMGYAKKGNWQRILELEAIIKDEGFAMNVGSYAAIFYYLGKHKGEGQMRQKQFRHYLEDMENKGLKPNDLFTKTSLEGDQYAVLLGLIRSYIPSFEVELQGLPLSSQCILLKDLQRQQRPYSSPAEGLLRVDELQKLAEEQLKMETMNYTKIKTIEKLTDSMETLKVYRERLRETEDRWRKSVEESLERNLKLLLLEAKRRSLHYLSVYPYMKVLDKQDYVDIVMQEIRILAEGSEMYSPTTMQLHRELGHKVYLRYRIKHKIKTGSYDKISEMMRKYSEWYLTPSGPCSNTRQQWQTLLQQCTDRSCLDGTEKQWPSAVLSSVGKLLYSIIIMDLKIDVNVMRIAGKHKEHLLPAFYSLFRTKGKIMMEEIKPHPILSRLYRAAAPEYLTFEAWKIPMVCPPVPWSTIKSGGYLITETDLIRLPFNAASQWTKLQETPPEQLYPSLDSLNQLGSVPWTVNEEVLDVVINVFNNGGCSKLDVPEPSSSISAPEPVTSDMTRKERFQQYKQRMAVRRRRAEMYSLWCDALYKLSLANHFRKRIFWLPHNMDFRGRVYPVAPHLNHLGSDLSRSLLIFAKGKPLGRNGLDWLKIHIVNLMGTHKKSSLQERLDFANSEMENILDSAERPLVGRQWWTNSEEPWQTLAACMELRAAVTSGDPNNYVSRFPVHQDGSCNGLQHYAALGRDQAGAESVNLTPADRPQDVYNCVVQIVERERAKDAANGVEIAKALEGFVVRKVIKQTIMTTVYGVTRYGARLQIAKQLKDLDNFPQEHIWPASSYLVGKTFDSLQEMFTSTKEIQDWLTDCARLISMVCSEKVEWVTPLGLTIVQPYTRGPFNGSQPKNQFGKISSCSVDTYERPNMMKQRNAFPPNFIHSLDSSHMMLTSLWSEHEAITFVSVHDCFWTHACTVDVMNRVCRQQFVALHSQPILQDLSAYLMNRYAYPMDKFRDDGSVASCAKLGVNRLLQELPKTGSFQIDSVLKSVYFFS